MIIEIHGLASVIEGKFIMPSGLPIEFKPLYFSENEVLSDKSNSDISSADSFEKFRGENKTGYFLHSKNCLIDLSLSNNLASAFIEVKRKVKSSTIVELLKIFATEGVQYAIAMDWDEWRYRNGLVKQIGSSMIENWIGRDFNHYLPGLYWGNLISLDLLEKHHLDLSFLEGMSEVYEILNGKFLFVSLFEKPEEWQEFAPDIDDICESTNGIFSKWDIWDKLELIEDQETYFKECKKYP